jgi:hypothetical protein
MKTANKHYIETTLLELGVARLKTFGFIHVNADNIMQDEVYQYFFEKILKDEELKNPVHSDIINQMLQKLGSAKPLTKPGWQ